MQIKKSWQDYFSTLDDNQKWQIDFVQNTDLQKASLDDVKVAQDKGRQAAITHNAALKQQTLGAKAAKLATNGLKLALNALASIGISMVISAVFSWVDDLMHASEKFSELADEARSRAQEYEEENQALDDLISKYEELAKSTSRDASTDKEILALQQEIVNLVGYENDTIDDKLDKLDLVNGKHDEEIKKLKEIAYRALWGRIFFGIILCCSSFLTTHFPYLLTQIKDFSNFSRIIKYKIFASENPPKLFIIHYSLFI